MSIHDQPLFNELRAVFTNVNDWVPTRLRKAHELMNKSNSDIEHIKHDCLAALQAARENVSDEHHQGLDTIHHYFKAIWSENPDSSSSADVQTTSHEVNEAASSPLHFHPFEPLEIEDSAAKEPAPDACLTTRDEPESAIVTPTADPIILGGGYDEDSEVTDFIDLDEEPTADPVILGGGYDEEAEVTDFVGDEEPTEDPVILGGGYDEDAEVTDFVDEGREEIVEMDSSRPAKENEATEGPNKVPDTKQQHPPETS